MVSSWPQKAALCSAVRPLERSAELMFSVDLNFLQGSRLPCWAASRNYPGRPQGAWGRVVQGSGWG